jgi:5-methylthioribose kinase
MSSAQQLPPSGSRSEQYRILREADLRGYLAQLPAIAGRLGGLGESPLPL